MEKLARQSGSHCQAVLRNHGVVTEATLLRVLACGYCHDRSLQKERRRSSYKGHNQDVARGCRGERWVGINCGEAEVVRMPGRVRLG